MGNCIDMKKLSVHLVVWNGIQYIPYLFDSLRKQTCADWQLVIVDNGSVDGTLDAIKKELQNFPVRVELIENNTNLGFAGGQNIAWKKNESEYVAMINQDMYLMPDCLEKAVSFLNTHVDAAVVSPRLMKWEFAKVKISLQDSFSECIDSLGLKVFRSRQVVEKLTGRLWSEVQKEFSKSAYMHVFGVSGALPIFRASLLRNILFENRDIFDPLYHAYKEDVDLAYRLAAFGGKAYVLCDTVAYHDRSAVGLADKNDKAAAANKKNQSPWVRYLSYKNHLMTLYKNEYWQNLILDFPWILWYELKKFVYFLLADRLVLKGLCEIWQYRHDLRCKRKMIKKQHIIRWKQMRALWKL